MASKRGTSPSKSKVSKILFEDNRPRIVVKISATSGVQDPSAGQAWIEHTLTDRLNSLQQTFGAFSFKPKYTPEVIKKASALAHKGQQLDKSYRPSNFALYFELDSGANADQASLVKQLLTFDEIESAYIDRAGPDPAVNALDDPRFGNQGYLDPAPDGIDAEYAWTFVGGDGGGQRFIDLERGWTLDHEDIAGHGGTLLHGSILDSSRAHGTSVLGEICAVDNTLGCVGITPNIESFDVVSYSGSDRVSAIIEAIDHLNFGDVLLLEAQVWLNGTTLLGPIEAYDAEFEAIRLATALGIIVVEAGGNGTNNGSAPPLNMDTYTTLSGEQIFNPAPTNPDFRDSGAIIVSAATSAAPHTRRAYGPHGARIDCYAWSQNIDTLDSDATGSTNDYRTNFGGTSGASPIIVGAALAVQGIMQAQQGYRLSPLQMRALLSNPAFGTPPAATETTAIGVMPDLRLIIDNALSVAHDVYLRDNLGDAGEPHSGSISSSPDVILRPDPVADPQALFGAGSGNENSSTLGYQIEAGQDNYLYTRVLNQGGSAATNVTITLYWSEVSTLVTADMWTELGSTTIASVPAGEVLTVSDAIVWDKDNLPPEGHYCLVAIIGTEADPAPLPTDFGDWSNFRRFIQDNNNVTWRNFNVVDNEPDDPSVAIDGLKFKALPFLSPGAPDVGRKMQLEVAAKLPEGARVYLEAPRYYANMVADGAANTVQLDKKEVSYIPILRNGKHRLNEVTYRAKIKNPMRLLVHIPKGFRKNDYEVHVKQLFEAKEVGRVSFQLTSKTKKRAHFELYIDKAKEYRWRLRTVNGEIIADSGEGYKNKKDCLHGIDLVKAVTMDLPVQTLH